MKNNLKGSLILLLTALIWGIAFVAQSDGAKAMGPFTFNAIRCIIGTIFLLLMVVVRSIPKKSKNESFKVKFKSGWSIIGGTLCGISLAIAMAFQQAGISSYPDGEAAASRAGFLTALYVVLVAICSIFKNKKVDVIVVVAALVATVGLYMISFSGGIDNIYIGDILCIACAFCFTVQIFFIDKYADGDCVKLSCFQFFVSAIVSIILAVIFEGTQYLSLSIMKEAAFSLLYLGIVSSGVAYTLQMVGQKYAEPAIASIVMSLESTFAALGGWLFANEHLGTKELFGCILMFIAVIGAQIPGLLNKNKT